MKKTIFFGIIFLIAVGCAEPQVARTPATLNLDIHLAGRPVLGQPLTLKVGAPMDQLKAEDLQLILPKGYTLLSQQAKANNTKEFVIKPGEPGIAELVIKRKGQNPAQGSVYVYLARPEGSKMASPIELSATIEPTPGLGKTLHVKAWATARVDSPNTTLEIRAPEGLSMPSSGAAVTRDLAANETLELSADMLVEREGEFPVEIEALSKTSEDLFWGRNMTFFVQVGAPFGNAVTEFSQDALNSTNESQIERGTPLPPPAEPALPPKNKSTVEPVPISNPIGAAARPESYPNPAEAVPFEVTIPSADKPIEQNLEKPPYTPAGDKQVPPDQPTAPSNLPPDLKPELPDPDDAEAPSSAVGWNLMMFEGFEGAFPNGSWDSFDNNGSSYGEYYWDDDDAMANTGSWSAWPANGGANGVDPALYYYPDNMDSWMVYGPFDLSDCSEAEYSFYYWNKSEPNFDYFGWAASGNGSNFYGYQLSGDQSSLGACDIRPRLLLRRFGCLDHV